MGCNRIGRLHYVANRSSCKKKFGLPASCDLTRATYLRAITSHSVTVSSQLVLTPRMATDSKAVNGNYGAQYPYGQAEPFVPPQSRNASNGNTPAGISGEDGVITAAPTSSEPTGVGEANKAPSKDEVGWYFVESYYTTLSKNPETLYVRKRTIRECEILHSLHVFSCTTTNGPSSFLVSKRRKLMSRLASGYAFLFARGQIIADSTCRPSMTV